jgi:hypothetical protein
VTAWDVAIIPVGRPRCATRRQHRIAGLVCAVVGFIHHGRLHANDLSNFIRSDRSDRLRVAFACDDELHRDASRDNAGRRSNEAQTRIVSNLAMFDAPTTRAVAETSAGDTDDEE